MTREEGYTSSESENCGSKIEKSEVENQKSEKAQALNKISSNLNQPIQLKGENTEVDNLLYSYATCALKNIKSAVKLSPSDITYHSDMNKAVSLNKKLKKIENNKDITSESFLKKKNVNVYLEMDEESDEIFGDIVKQISLSKCFYGELSFVPSSKEAVSKIDIPKYFELIFSFNKTFKRILFF